MSATNSTTYYEFPVFVGSDKPAWLVDWNGAMNAIDSAIHEAKAEADANATNISSLQSDVTSLAGSVSSQGSSITSLTQSLTSLQGTVNTITSLIGNGEPTTQDKTIIGAINELKADIDAIAPSGDVKADDVTYDNTSSGLTATDVQSAIDEINGKIPQGGSVDADDVTYDNTSSGLTATNVQDAIDELAQSGGSVTPTKIGFYTSTQTGVTADLSSYSFIGLALGFSNGDIVINSVVFPKALITSGVSLDSRAYDTGGSANKIVRLSNITNAGFDITVTGAGANEGAIVYAW